MDRIIRVISPAKRIVVPCHSQPVTIICGNVIRTDHPIVANSKSKPIMHAQLQTNAEKSRLFQVERQIVLEMCSPHPLLVTTISPGICTIEPKQVSGNYHWAASTDGIADVSRKRHF